MKKRTLIVVEDDAAIRESLEELLVAEGYPVRAAAHGRDGLALIRESEGDCLVLLDLQMPVMTGEQLLDALAEEPDPRVRATPIVVLTAQGEPLRRRVAAFIRKPIDVDELLRTIAFLAMA